ncbi:hypothetical protein AB6A40_003097 [Gnathostoma spinigerum]|uniref:Uncharacterized protein n=1 Tax=Gnathostoma spinigerum TaxID=75299 RepID=A0ABD6E8I8_9BILA
MFELSSHHFGDQADVSKDEFHSVSSLSVVIKTKMVLTVADNQCTRSLLFLLKRTEMLRVHLTKVFRTK